MTKIERERAKEKAIHDKLDKILKLLGDGSERQKGQAIKKTGRPKEG